jgi:hypothetical protein
VGKNLAVPSDRPAPGTVELSEGSPNILSLFAQWDFGHAGVKPNRPQWREPDTAEWRIEWFNACLERAANVIPEGSRVAIPYRVGCGLAGGHWSTYLNLIRTWALKNGFYVTIYKKKIFKIEYISVQ